MTFIVGGLVMPFLYGFVVTRLWEWFVEPLWNVHLGLFVAVGICELVSVVTLSNLIIPPKVFEPKGLVLAAKAFAALWSLGFGWVIHAAIISGLVAA